MFVLLEAMLYNCEINMKSMKNTRCFYIIIL